MLVTDRVEITGSSACTTASRTQTLILYEVWTTKAPCAAAAQRYQNKWLSDENWDELYRTKSY